MDQPFTIGIESDAKLPGSGIARVSQCGTRLVTFNDLGSIAWARPGYKRPANGQITILKPWDRLRRT